MSLNSCLVGKFRKSTSIDAPITRPAHTSAEKELPVAWKEFVQIILIVKSKERRRDIACWFLRPLPINVSRTEGNNASWRSQWHVSAHLPLLLLLLCPSAPASHSWTFTAPYHAHTFDASFASTGWPQNSVDNCWISSHIVEVHLSAAVAVHTLCIFYSKSDMFRKQGVQCHQLDPKTFKVQSNEGLVLYQLNHNSWECVI